jgi:hypothetical protein
VLTVLVHGLGHATDGEVRVSFNRHRAVLMMTNATGEAQAWARIDRVVAACGGTVVYRYRALPIQRSDPAWGAPDVFEFRLRSTPSADGTRWAAAAGDPAPFIEGRATWSATSADVKAVHYGDWTRVWTTAPDEDSARARIIDLATRAGVSVVELDKTAPQDYEAPKPGPDDYATAPFAVVLRRLGEMLAPFGESDWDRILVVEHPRGDLGAARAGVTPADDYEERWRQLRRQVASPAIRVRDLGRFGDALGVVVEWATPTADRPALDPASIRVVCGRVGRPAALPARWSEPAS